MQHPDEGTIHAWLDGALTADEAGRVEAHVKDCPQCQAAVAEARGFIAASSRILTALDNAPRGVIPAAPAKKRVQPWVWRVAATVLVVAGGTLVIMLPHNTAKMRSTTVQDSVLQRADNTAPVTKVTESAATPSADMQREGSQSLATAPSVSAAPLVKQSPRAFSAAPTQAPARSRADRDLSANQADGEVSVGERRQAAARPTVELSEQVAAAAPMMNRPFGALSDVVTSTPREVDKKRTVSTTQTFYEITPGDTVMLEEQTHAELQSVVVTGAGAAVTRSAQPRALSGKAAAVAEPQQKVEVATPPPPPPAAMQDAKTTEIHRISWLDRSTGRVLVLSGRHSQDELQRIREQIQRLRDAPAQSIKPPD